MYVTFKIPTCEVCGESRIAALIKRADGHYAGLCPEHAPASPTPPPTIGLLPGTSARM